MGVDAEMLVRVRAPLTAKQVTRIGWEMGGAFWPDKFFISSGDYVRRALTIVKKWEQDGPTLRPKEGEQFLRVSLAGRYYGPRYERGDLPLYIAVAKWLEQRIPREPGKPKAVIWYGGDSSGICSAPFGPEEREALFRHFVEHGHRPYGDWDGGEVGFARSCAFCGGEPMQRFMWGGHNLAAGYRCGGCGFEEETRDGGASWNTTHEVGGRKVRATEKGSAASSKEST